MHAHADGVRAHGVALLGLERVHAGRRERQRGAAVGARELPADRGARHRRAVLAVGDGDVHRLAGVGAAGGTQLEQVGLGEEVVGEEHVVAVGDLLLAAADLRGRVVERVAPRREVRGPAVGVRADPVDPEVLEAVEPRSVPGEAAGQRPVVERGRHRRAGRCVGAVVGPVARVRARGVLGQRLCVGRDGRVEQRCARPLDPQVHGRRCGEGRRYGGNDERRECEHQQQARPGRT